MSCKTLFSKDCDKYWSVTANEKTQPYWNTSVYGVIGKTAEEVACKVLAAHPESKIVSINHKGAIDL
jgi:hypothetical protein